MMLASSFGVKIICFVFNTFGLIIKIRLILHRLTKMNKYGTLRVPNNFSNFQEQYKIFCYENRCFSWSLFFCIKAPFLSARINEFLFILMHLQCLLMFLRMRKEFLEKNWRMMPFLFSFCLLPWGFESFSCSRI